MNISALCCVLLLLTPSVTWAQPTPAMSEESVRVDSIVLERTVCLGTCPAYRLRLDSAGRIHFRLRNPGDSLIATDSISPAGLQFLHREAVRIQFFSLPGELVGTELCREAATDHPTATVSIYTAAGMHRVRDYEGCYERADHSVTRRVANLRVFERQIDGVTGSFRWARPNRRR